MGKLGKMAAKNLAKWRQKTWQNGENGGVDVWGEIVYDRKINEKKKLREGGGAGRGM